MEIDGVSGLLTQLAPPWTGASEVPVSRKPVPDFDLAKSSGAWAADLPSEVCSRVVATGSSIVEFTADSGWEL